MSARYAVVPARGMYGSGEKIHVWRHYGNLPAAQATAAELTRLHRQGMARHGGSSGGYRVIECAISTRAISGYDLDRTPDAR